MVLRMVRSQARLTATLWGAFWGNCGSIARSKNAPQRVAVKRPFLQLAAKGLFGEFALRQTLAIGDAEQLGDPCPGFARDVAES